jgi:hypothetical protein
MLTAQIVSMMISFPNSHRFLHYNFVVTLLNDLFGIQSRGGCACAGPYGHFLMALTPDASSVIESELLEENEIIRCASILFFKNMSHITRG